MAGENRDDEKSTAIDAVTEHGPGEGFTFLEFGLLLARSKRIVIGVPLGASLLALAITFIISNWYTGVVRILPPQQSQSNAVAILGQLGALATGATQALGLKNPSDVYVAILKSTSVANRLIQRFDLMKIYDEDYLVEARKELARNSTISSSRDGIITIEVEDTDPSRAATLANAYVEELRALTVSLAVTEASQRRLFFEDQVKKTKNDLIDAEAQLRTFSQSSGLINPQGQIGLSVAAAAALRAQIAAREIQLAAIRSYATDTNPEVERINQELRGLRAEVSKVESDTGMAKSDVLVSLNKAPVVGLEYVRRYREVRYFETLYEALAKQYEIARIDEAKDATLIQVLDSASPPERKSKPRRLLISLTAFLLGLFVAIGFVVIREKIEQIKRDPDRAKQLRELWMHLNWR